MLFLLKSQYLDNILSKKIYNLPQNKIQQNEVVLYLEGKYIWVGVNGFFAGGSIF